jgi:hypothetical protein
MTTIINPALKGGALEIISMARNHFNDVPARQAAVAAAPALWAAVWAAEAEAWAAATPSEAAAAAAKAVAEAAEVARDAARAAEAAREAAREATILRPAEAREAASKAGTAWTKAAAIVVTGSQT